MAVAPTCHRPASKPALFARSHTSRKFPINPAHPERVCWGCDLFCAAKDMRCGNGSDRTAHPVELFGQGGETAHHFAVRAHQRQPVAAEVAHGSCTDVPLAHG